MTNYFFKIGIAPIVRKRLKKVFHHTFRYSWKQDRATIFFKYFTCPDCDSNYFNEDLFLHGLEHEIIEIEVLKIVDEIDPELHPSKGFDYMALKWHCYKIFHECPKNINTSGFNVS